MINQPKPEEIYAEQILKYSVILKRLKGKRTYLEWLRLIVVIIILILIYYLFSDASLFTWIAAAAAIIFFLYLISYDTDNNNKIADIERMLLINNEELSALKGDYYKRDEGFSFLPEDHPYAGDIDLFGHASIFQYMNRCTSEQSKKLLAALLLKRSETNTIEERREAAKNLAPLYDWRQQFQSTGIADPLTVFTQEKISYWLNMPSPFSQKHWQIIPYIFTAGTLTCLFLYISNWLLPTAFWLLVFVFFLVAKFTSAKINKTYLAFTKIEDEVKTIHRQLKLVENLSVSSALLRSYQTILVSQSKGSASIKELEQVLKRFNFRLNALVFLVLNTFLLWDLRQIKSLNKWKEKNKIYVPQWFTILENVEVINTLATLTFNHPDWVFPVISNDHFTLEADEMGHPLINAEKRVNNSFTTKGTGKISIITGSNMAGKSTFLRSIAVNLVLAQMGAPVCAKAFSCSPVFLYSSMRIADNLAENTSTFYAELKKLKNIIDQVNKREKVFILLDEILRGTNSPDRHTGSKALIKQLIRAHAVAVIATHDVELTNLENDYKDSVTNYHFDVQVEGEELYFDYKLKEGICKSMNATLLMKKIGIEIKQQA